MTLPVSVEGELRSNVWYILHSDIRYTWTHFLFSTSSKKSVSSKLTFGSFFTFYISPNCSMLDTVTCHKSRQNGCWLRLIKPLYYCCHLCFQLSELIDKGLQVKIFSSWLVTIIVRVLFPANIQSCWFSGGKYARLGNEIWTIDCMWCS